MKTNNKGFSLVELIVVIAIMAILAAVAIPTFASFITKANVASDEQFIADVEYAIELANAKFDKKATSIDINATNGAISTVTYVIDNETITITVNTETKTAVSSVADSTKGYAEAAKDVISSIDWSYSFKSADYANGTPDAQ